MNEDNLHSWMEPEFEARIIALILGEASDFEKEETERRIAESPEANLFFKRMANLHAHLATLPLRSEEEDKDWKLSPEKREKLLETIGKPRKKADPSAPNPKVIKPNSRLATKWKVIIPIAASIAFLALVGSLAVGTLDKFEIAGVDSSSLKGYASWYSRSGAVAFETEESAVEHSDSAAPSDFNLAIVDERKMRSLNRSADTPMDTMAAGSRNSRVPMVTSRSGLAPAESPPVITAAEPLSPPKDMIVANNRSTPASESPVYRSFTSGITNGPAAGGAESREKVAKKPGLTAYSGSGTFAKTESPSNSKLGFPVSDVDKDANLNGGGSLTISGQRGEGKKRQNANSLGDQTITQGLAVATGGTLPTGQPEVSKAKESASADIRISGRTSASARPQPPVTDQLAAADPYADSSVVLRFEQGGDESGRLAERESLLEAEMPANDLAANGSLKNTAGIGTADPFSDGLDHGVAPDAFFSGLSSSRRDQAAGEVDGRIRALQGQAWDAKESEAGDDVSFGFGKEGSRAASEGLDFPNAEVGPDPSSVDPFGGFAGGGGGGAVAGNETAPKVKSDAYQNFIGEALDLGSDTSRSSSLERKSLQKMNRLEELNKRLDEVVEKTELSVEERIVDPQDRGGLPVENAESKRGEVGKGLVEDLEEVSDKITEKPEDVPVGYKLAGLAIDEKSATEEPFSTFSLHVGDSSFHLARAALSNSQWPEQGTIRVEEFVNALDYRDPIPTHEEKVSVALDQARHPFLQQRNLLRISLATAARGRQASVPLRLTLLLDNSGSMDRPDRHETVQRAFSLLLAQLQENDEVTLISFARQPRLLADRVKGAQSAALVDLVGNLPSEGGTNLEAALELAFQKAQEQQIPNAQNRIILLTDGAANLGDAEPDRLGAKIETFRDAGIAFDAAGIGAQGLNDEILEALTRKGDGRYYLLDRPEDADAGFARQIAGALRPAAGNVKVQVEFNPDRVGAYKLIGFEKHRLKKEEFRNDAVDAAELAAAEAGVALYQVEAKPDGRGDLGFVSVRFRDLSSGEMVEKRWPILYDPNTPPFEQAAPAIRIAGSAAFLGSRLREDALGQTVDLGTLSNVLNDLPSVWNRDEGLRQLRDMVQQTRALTSE